MERVIAFAWCRSWYDVAYWKQRTKSKSNRKKSKPIHSVTSPELMLTDWVLPDSTPRDDRFNIQDGKNIAGIKSYVARPRGILNSEVGNEYFWIFYSSEKGLFSYSKGRKRGNNLLLNVVHFIIIRAGFEKFSFLEMFKIINFKLKVQIQRYIYLFYLIHFKQNWWGLISFSVELFR